MDKEVLDELRLLEPERFTGSRTHINALLYGDWGVGKTTLALSSGKPTLFISSGDGGESVLLDFPEDIRSQVHTVRCNGLSHLKAIFQAITEGIEGYGKYEVVVIDNISMICQQFLKNLVDKYSSKTSQKDRSLATPRTPGTKLKNLEAEGMGDYKFLANHMRDLAPVSSAAPVDKIWLAHEREPTFTDEQKGIFLTRPKMPNEASDALAEVCHLVGILEKKKQGTKISRIINFNGSDRLAAKSRIKQLEGKQLEVTDHPEKFWEVIESWRS